jgi:hypothetical protein
MIVVACFVFEAGRWAAGYSVVAATADRLAARSRAQTLQEQVEGLERQVAAGEVGRRIDREAQVEAQRMIGELQAQLGRQQQELQFYRGVLAKQYAAGTLRVQEIGVQRAAGSRRVVEVTLVQASARDSVVSGTLTLWFAGTRNGALTRLPLAQLSPTGRGSIAFSLRYFQKLDVPVELPPGFVPGGIEVELRVNRPGAEPERQSFPWPAA